MVACCCYSFCCCSISFFSLFYFTRCSISTVILFACYFDSFSLSRSITFSLPYISHLHFSEFQSNQSTKWYKSLQNAPHSCLGFIIIIIIIIIVFINNIHFQLTLFSNQVSSARTSWKSSHIIQIIIIIINNKQQQQNGAKRNKTNQVSNGTSTRANIKMFQSKNYYNYTTLHNITSNHIILMFFFVVLVIGPPWHIIVPMMIMMITFFRSLSLIHSLSRSLTHSLTHSLTYSLPHIGGYKPSHHFNHIYYAISAYCTFTHSIQSGTIESIKCEWDSMDISTPSLSPSHNIDSVTHRDQRPMFGNRNTIFYIHTHTHTNFVNVHSYCTYLIVLHIFFIVRHTPSVHSDTVPLWNSIIIIIIIIIYHLYSI